MKKVIWLVVITSMTLSLVVTACGPAATPPTPGAPTTPGAPAAPTPPTTPTLEKSKQEVVKPTLEAPKHGGTLTLSLASDITGGWDDIVSRTVLPSRPFGITNEPMWITDWAKGAAGGSGPGETDFFTYYDIFGLKAGLIAESWKWTANWEKDEGTIVYQIRQNIHWALNPKSEASRLAAGRQLTADDVVFSLQQKVQDPRAYFYRANPDLKNIEITKTGPWEVTIKKIPPLRLMSLLSNFGDSNGRIVPPEVVKKYGDMAKWQNSVGTGPFMLTDFVPGSQAVMVRNPNYWMKDPVGPGKGNQFPYLDTFRYLILPDLSTRQAALRTGKIDRLSGVSLEDAKQFRKTSPKLLDLKTETTGPSGIGKFPIQIRQDATPFKDIRVRQALFMATDFEAINQGLFGGLGYILTMPYEYLKPYADLYLGLNDPDVPAAVKELFTYNPDRARQLLKEAGYPNGFKTEAVLTATEVDSWAIFKGMWAKVGIELELKVMEPVAKTTFLRDRRHQGLTAYGFQPFSTFYEAGIFEKDKIWQLGMIIDPSIDEAMAKVRRAYVTDQREAMKLARELSKYILAQAYAMPVPYGPVYTFWWPWLKNYTGEDNMGYHFWDAWTAYVWYDTELKKSMGY